MFCRINLHHQIQTNFFTAKLNASAVKISNTGNSQRIHFPVSFHMSLRLIFCPPRSVLFNSSRIKCVYIRHWSQPQQPRLMVTQWSVHIICQPRLLYQVLHELPEICYIGFLIPMIQIVKRVIDESNYPKQTFLKTLPTLKECYEIFELLV